MPHSLFRDPCTVEPVYDGPPYTHYNVQIHMTLCVHQSFWLPRQRNRAMEGMGARYAERAWGEHWLEVQVGTNSYPCELDILHHNCHYFTGSFSTYSSTPLHAHICTLHPYPVSVRPLPWVWLTLRMASCLRWCLETGRWGCSRSSPGSYTECLMNH